MILMRKIYPIIILFFILLPIQAQELLFPLPHRGPVLDIVFTPDGKKIITLSEDKTIKISDFISKATLRTINAEPGETPLSLLMLKDGKRFIYSTNVNSYIINIETGSKIGKINGLTGRLAGNGSILTAGTYLSSNSDNPDYHYKMLRTVSDSSYNVKYTFQMWLSEGLQERQITTNCNSCGFDAYMMNEILAYSDYNHIHFFDIQKQRNIDSISMDTEEAGYALCFSVDPLSGRVFVPTHMGISEFSTSGKIVRTIKADSTWNGKGRIDAYRLYFHNGRHYMCNSDGSLIVIDDNTGKVIFRYKEEEHVDEIEEGIISLAFHPEKNIVAVGFEKKNYFKIIDLDKNSSYKFESLRTSAPRKLKISDDENEIYVDTRFSGSIINLGDLTKRVVLNSDHEDSDYDFDSGNSVWLSSGSNMLSFNNLLEPFSKDSIRWLPTFGKKVSFLTKDTVIVSLGAKEINDKQFAEVIVLSREDILKGSYPPRYGTIYSHESTLDITDMNVSQGFIITYNPDGDLKFVDFRKSYPTYNHETIYDADGNVVKLSHYGGESDYNLYDERYNYIYDISNQPGNNFFVVVGKGNYPFRKIAVIDKTKGKRSFEVDSLEAKTVCFINDSTIATGTTNGSIIKFKVDFGKKRLIKISEKKVLNEPVEIVKYLPGKRKFVICTNDNRIYFTDENLNKIAYYFATDDDNFIYLDSLNNYFASRDVVKNVYFRENGKVFSFDQFDCYFNRPDKIIRALTPNDTIQIRRYEELYKKRIKKAGLKEDSERRNFELPTIKILSPEKIPQSTSVSRISFSAEFGCNSSPLSKATVWLNEVPVQKIDCRNKNRLTKKVDIELISGSNKIQISVINSEGVESYKETVYTAYVPVAELKPDLYLITIGDSKYKDPKYNLTYGAKDAEDIRSLFSGNKSAIYNNVFSFKLLDEQVSAANILNLKKNLLKARREDVVIITFAGHGLVDNKWDYYLATYNIDFKNPVSGGLPYEQLENLLDGIAPVKKILLIDACHSGEIDKEEMVQVSDKLTASSSDLQFRSAGNLIRLKSSAIKSTSELLKELFTDIRRGTGATIISSASGSELAIEGDQWKNGLFTYCLLNGLYDKKADLNNDGQIMISELQKYLGKEVFDISRGMQRPSSRMENSYLDYRIW